MNTNPVTRLHWLLGLFALLIASTAFAQTETGQIIGKVTDPSGAVIPNATVKVKSVSTGSERTATTGGDGVYAVTNLLPGNYSVTVQATGFSPVTKQANVTVGSRVDLDVALQVTAITGEVVEVVATGGVEVNTQSQELSTVVSGKQITDLPSLTRNPYDFVALAGNVTSDPGGSTGRGVGVAINGQRASNTNVQLDGADNNNTFTASTGQNVPLDSVQEFRVVTSNFSAEYGRAGGGIVNLATRGGTNQFHGAAYEYNRVSRLASNGFDNNANGLAKPGFVRNQFGFRLGGPVVKDKLLFFHNTEWIRVRSSAEVRQLVPTSQFIATAATATRNYFAPHSLTTPINGRVYTASQVRATLPASFTGPFANLATTQPNLPVFGEVRYNLPSDQGAGNPQNTYLTISRVDWNISDKTQIYARYALENSSLFSGVVSSSPWKGFNTGQTDLNNNVLVSMTRTLSDRLVSQTKLVYNRLNNLQPLGEQPDGTTLYFTGGTARLLGTSIANPGYLPFTPGSGIPFGGPQNLGQVFEDINYNVGNHQLRFGGQYVYIQDNRAFGAYQTTTQQLGTTLGNGLNNFLNGELLLFQGAINPQGKYPGDRITLPVGPPDFTRSNRYHDFAWYATDAWRVKPRLNLNLGVRYEYYGVQHNVDPKKDSNFYFGSGSSLQERIRNGRVMLAQDSPVGGLWAKDLNNFAPRLGFAWDMFGNGKTSLRGGVGMGYERNFGNVTFNVIQNPPNYAVVSLLAGVDVPGAIPVTTNKYGPLAGSSGSTILPVSSLRWVRPDIRTAYSTFYSGGIQHELTNRTVVSLEYSGSAGQKLYSLENYNRNGFGTFYLGSNAARPAAIGGSVSRLNGQFGNINARANGGFSRFNSLTASIESANLSNLGLQFTAKYTYGVARDNLSSTFSESFNNNNLGLLDPFANRLDYGYADFDIRQRFTSGFNWDLPFGKSGGLLAKNAIGGWTLSGIFVARTGTPFTVFDCNTATATVCIRAINSGLNFTGASNPKADDASDDGVVTPNRFNFVDLSKYTLSNFTDVSGGHEVGPYPANMTRRNSFRAPGLWDLTFSLHKRFYITENYTLQFRGEFYNVFNHANMFVLRSETDASSFAYVPTVRDGRRNVQLAVRFEF